MQLGTKGWSGNWHRLKENNKVESAVLEEYIITSYRLRDDGDLANINGIIVGSMFRRNKITVFSSV